MAGRAVRLVVASMVVAAFAAGAEAAPRAFAIHTPASSGGALYEVNQATGQSSFVANLLGRAWGDLAGRPGDAEHVYAIGRIPGGSFQNRVSRINVTTGVMTDLFTFTGVSLGFGSNSTLLLEGIAFDPLDSSVVTLGGITVPNGGSITPILFDVDLDTGAVSNLVMSPPTGLIGDLSYGPDGTLYTIRLDSPRRFATIDPSSGAVTNTITCSSPSCTVDSFDFDLFTGQMFAIDGAGNFVRISPSTAATLELIGSTGLPGTVGALAFMVPEPGTGALLAAGLALLAVQRRRARR